MVYTDIVPRQQWFHVASAMPVLIDHEPAYTLTVSLLLGTADAEILMSLC